MTRRTLYVHVGPRKTGTTAVQSVLRNHDNSIVVYPKAGLFGDGSHHNLVYAFFGKKHGNKKFIGDRGIEALFARIASEAMASDRNVVISSEVLDPKLHDIRAFIEALLPHISRGPVDVEILLACREHFARAASWYNQRVRASEGQNRRLPDQFLSARADEICYAPLVRGLRDTGFKVTALDYQPSDTWTDRFFSHIGFRGTEIPKKVEQKRVSLSRKALVATIAANRIVRANDEREKLLDTFANLLNSRSPSGFIFGREVAASAETLFSEDRKFLLEECNIRIVPPNLDSPESMLYIDTNEFEDIVSVARPMGKTGEKIIAFVRQYLRNDARIVGVENTPS